MSDIHFDHEPPPDASDILLTADEMPPLDARPHPDARELVTAALPVLRAIASGHTAPASEMWHYAADRMVLARLPGVDAESMPRTAAGAARLADVAERWLG